MSIIISKTALPGSLHYHRALRGLRGAGDRTRTDDLRITSSKSLVSWYHLSPRNVRSSWVLKGPGRPLSPTVTPRHPGRSSTAVAQLTQSGVPLCFCSVGCFASMRGQDRHRLSRCRDNKLSFGGNAVGSRAMLFMDRSPSCALTADGDDTRAGPRSTAQDSNLRTAV